MIEYQTKDKIAKRVENLLAEFPKDNRTAGVRAYFARYFEQSYIEGIVAETLKKAGVEDATVLAFTIRKAMAKNNIDTKIAR